MSASAEASAEADTAKEEGTDTSVHMVDKALAEMRERTGILPDLDGDLPLPAEPIPIPDPNVKEGAAKPELGVKPDSDAEGSGIKPDETDPGFGHGAEAGSETPAVLGKTAFGTGATTAVRAEGTEVERVLRPAAGDIIDHPAYGDLTVGNASSDESGVEVGLAGAGDENAAASGDPLGNENSNEGDGEGAGEDGGDDAYDSGDLLDGGDGLELG